jgi:hypothetical protein
MEEKQCYSMGTGCGNIRCDKTNFSWCRNISCSKRDTETTEGNATVITETPGYARYETQAEEKIMRTAQNKYELLLLGVLVLSSLFVRDFIIPIMIFGIIPAILMGEWVFNTSNKGVGY